MPLHQPCELAVAHTLSRPEGALSQVCEDGLPARHLNVSLAQRRDAEGLVLGRVPLATNAEEALADQSHDRRGNSPARWRACRGVRTDARAECGQMLGQLAHAIILPQLSAL